MGFSFVFVKTLVIASQMVFVLGVSMLWGTVAFAFAAGFVAVCAAVFVVTWFFRRGT